MDCSIILALNYFAHNLLFTSKRFEPYVPHSQQNIFYTLEFLDVLTEITQQNIYLMTSVKDNKKQDTAIAAKTQTFLKF